MLHIQYLARRRSTVDVALHTNAGLVGPIIIVKKGQLKDGKAADVDRELIVMMMVSCGQAASAAEAGQPAVAAWYEWPPAGRSRQPDN
jgi:hypothetical protein